VNSANPEILNRRLQAALAAEARGDRSAAADAYQAVLDIDAGHPGALYRQAQFALAHGERGRALTMFRDALSSARARGLVKQSLPIHTDRIVALREADALERLDAVREAVLDCGEVPGLLWEASECLHELGRSFERLHQLNRLAALQPNDAVILAELGLALLQSNSAPQAMLPMRRAIELGHDDVEFALLLAANEIQNDELQAAKARIETVLRKRPEHLGALGLLWHLAAQSCDWSAAEALETKVLARAAAGDAHATLTPWRLLASNASAALLRTYASAYARLGDAQKTTSEETARQMPLHTASPRKPHSRIRVGYLSCDFHQHATALLMAGVFEHHDAANFESFAYSYGARVQDAYRSRLQQRFEHWHELNELTDLAAAELIASHEIDVLIELKGHTYGVRPGIVAYRPAPIQAHYLGYPGTLAIEGIDYLIADDIVAPRENDEHFVETVLRLPRCYQANDDRRERPAAIPRSAIGLPQDAIVLCNFNQSWKWSKPFVYVWMNALAAHPQAMLWLLDPGSNHPAKQNILAYAASIGVSDRIVWAPKLAPTAHLARLAQADLALDQLPCNSHTTASDALWMGVPVLSCIGERLDARVAASLLHGVGASHLCFSSLDEYARALDRWLFEPHLLRAEKNKLNAAILGSSLFDTVAFAQDWTRNLASMHQAARVQPV
jgi:protein O-GlcNAc transferase